MRVIPSLRQFLRTEDRRGTLRSAAVFVVGVGAAIAVLLFLNDLYPIRTWLAIPVGTILGWDLLLNLAWIGGGAAITGRSLPRDLPALERLVIAVAVGVAAFGFGLYVLGAVGLLRTIPVLLLALALLGIGAQEMGRWVAEFLRDRVDGPRSGSSRALVAAATAFGVIGIGIAYLGIFTPDAINYDARWWHLKIAEDYAREGRLVPFFGNWVNAYPHLASLIHTWDFLVPGLPAPATRLMMVLHTEFSFFVWTLVALAATVRWLTSDGSVRGAWASLFLFPGVVVYDGNMGGASDHALAFFTLPLFLLSVRAPEQRSRRLYVLWGVVAGTALITKLQAVYALVPLTLLLSYRTIFVSSAVRGGLVRLGRAAPFAIGAFVIASAPHFLQNCLYHANPVYPLLQDWFPKSHPTVHDAPRLVREILMDFNWKAPAALGPKLKEGLELLFTFAFRPHYSFMNNLPTFGILFTMSLLLLPFISGSRRLWMGTLTALGAVFCWACTVRVDRNLQTVLPLLAAATTAVLIRAWRMGSLAQLGVSALVLLQIVWGADHLLSGTDRIGSSLALIHSGLEGRATTRFAAISADYFAVSRTLPRNAVILLHHSHLSLGFNRPVFLDIAGFQGSIDYGQFSTPRDYYDRLRALGVTHIVYMPGNQSGPSKQEDAVFHAFLSALGNPTFRVGPFEIFEMPATPPPQRSPLQVLTIGLGGYADGLYDVRSLGTCQALPGPMQTFAAPRIRADAQTYDGLAAESDVILIAPPVPVSSKLATRLKTEYEAVTPYPGLSVFVRKMPATR